MMYVFNETYESALNIPVPTRKWLITRWNKQKEKENNKNGTDDTSRPLTESERQQMIAKAAGTQRVQEKTVPPKSPANFMQSMRNQKT